MKSKKFIASIASIAMLAGSMASVSAAFTYEDVDGMVFITEMASEEEVKARSPKLAVDVEKLDNAKMSTIDTVYNTLYGKKVDGEGNYLYDIYRVTYTYSNIGPLALGYMNDVSGVGIAGTTIELDFGETSDKIVVSKAKDCSISSFSSNYGLSGNVLTYNKYTTTLTDPYPFVNEVGTIVEDPVITQSHLLVLNAGTKATFTLLPACGLSYIHLVDAAANNIPVSCVLPEVTTYTLQAPVSDIAVESVTLNKTELTLDLNGSTTATLTATVAPENASDKTVTWESSDPEVVAVDGGNLTAKKVGTATITAKAGDKSATCAVTVKDTTPPADPKGTVIQGADVIYAGSAAAATITAATKFQIEYTGSDESIKQPDGTKVKNISRTAEDILGGVIGEGSLTGTVHFGIKVPASVVGTDEAKHFQINVIND